MISTTAISTGTSSTSTPPTFAVQRTGDGEPIVLVHGSWTDASTWAPVVALLAADHHVVTYDRRGHSSSAHLEAGARHLDEDDLVGVIERLDVGPVHLVGNSYGGAIALGVAARRPDLVRSVSAHEPPLVLAGGPGSDLAALLTPIIDGMGTLADAIRRGDAAGAAERFVDELVLGPGAWSILPEEARRIMVANASTFVATSDDPAFGAVPPAPAATVRVLLTDGDASPGWLRAITGHVAATSHTAAARHTFAGAGHVPHATHPVEFAAVVAGFVRSSVVAS